MKKPTKKTKKTEKETLKRFDVYLTVHYKEFNADGSDPEVWDAEKKLNEGNRVFYFEGYDSDKDKLLLEQIKKAIEHESKTSHKYEMDEFSSLHFYQQEELRKLGCYGFEADLYVIRQNSKKFKTIKSLKNGIKELDIEIREFDIEKEKIEIIDRENKIKELKDFIKYLRNLKNRMSDEIEKLIRISDPYNVIRFHSEDKNFYNFSPGPILSLKSEEQALRELIESSGKILDDEEEILSKMKSLFNTGMTLDKQLKANDCRY